MGSHAYNQDPEPPVQWKALVAGILAGCAIAVALWAMGGGRVAACLGLSGCAMTNEQVVREVHYCESNGMKADRVFNGFTFSTIRIDCVPLERRSTGDATSTTPNSPAITGDGNVVTIDGSKR